MHIALGFKIGTSVLIVAIACFYFLNIDNKSNKLRLCYNLNKVGFFNPHIPS